MDFTFDRIFLTCCPKGLFSFQKTLLTQYNSGLSSSYELEIEYDSIKPMCFQNPGQRQSSGTLRLGLVVK